MKHALRAIPALLALTLLLPGLNRAAAAGFQMLDVPGGAGSPLRVGLWYPATGPVREEPIGPYSQGVVPGAPIRGTRLPLVVISHGAGGSLASHHDTAVALAEAGYIVAAPTHVGDSAEAAGAWSPMLLVDRARDIVATVDHLIGRWAERERIDRNRIGGFGHGDGAFAILVAAGGVPDFSRAGLHCRLQPGDSSCRLLAGPLPPRTTAWPRTSSFRSLVVAAPTFGFLFVPDGLGAVSQVVQLWRPVFDEVLMHPWHAEQVRYSLPNVPLYGEVAGASHYSFVAPCPDELTARLPEACLDPPGFDRARFHREFNAAVISFFNTSMR